MNNRNFVVLFSFLFSFFKYNTLFAENYIKDDDNNTIQLKEELILGNERPFEIKEIKFEGIGYVTNLSQLKKLSDNYVGKRYSIQLGQNLISDVYSIFDVESASLIKEGKKIIINCKPKIRLASIDIWVDKKVPNREQIKNEIIESLKKDGIISGLRINSITVETCIDNIKEKLKLQFNCDVKILADVLPILDNKACILKISTWFSKPISLRDMSIIGVSDEMHHKADKALPKSSLYLSRSLIKDFVGFNVDIGSIISLNTDIEQVYKNEGHLDVSLTSPIVTYSSNKGLMYVDYVVEREGNKSICGKITITGDEKTLELLKNFKEKFSYEGKVCKKQEITEDIETKIKGYLVNLGYNNCSVECIFDEKSEDSDIIDCKVFCRAGQLVYIRNVNFYHNVVVYDKILRNLLDTKEHTVFNKESIDNDVKRLFSLPIIGNVEPRIVNVPDNKQLVDVIYIIQQNSNARKFSMNCPGMNGSVIPFGFQVSEPNFLGLGRSISFNIDGKFSNKSSNVNVPIGNKILNYFKVIPQLDISLGYSDNITFGKNIGFNCNLGCDLGNILGFKDTKEQEEPKLGGFLNINSNSQLKRIDKGHYDCTFTKYSSSRTNNLGIEFRVNSDNIKYLKSIFNYQLYNTEIFDSNLIEKIDNGTNIGTDEVTSFVRKLKDISVTGIMTGGAEEVVSIYKNNFFMLNIGTKLDFSNLFIKNKDLLNKYGDKLSIKPNLFLISQKNGFWGDLKACYDNNKYNRGLLLSLDYSCRPKRKFFWCDLKWQVSTLFAPFRIADYGKVSKCSCFCKEQESLASNLSTISSRLSDYRDSKAIFIIKDDKNNYILANNLSISLDTLNKSYNSGSVGYFATGLGLKLPTRDFWNEYGSFGGNILLFYSFFVKQKDFSYFLLRKITSTESFKRDFSNVINAINLATFEKNYNKIPVFATIGSIFIIRNALFFSAVQFKIIFNTLYFATLLKKALGINIKSGPFVLGGKDSENEDKDFLQCFHFDFSMNEIDW